MSSVSERNSYTDDVRKTREEYQEREAEQVKKHKREMRRLTQEHDKEVSRIKENYENRIQDIRTKNDDRISDTDRRNQEKVDELRTLYLEQMKRKTGDLEDRNEVQRQVFEDTLSKEKTIHSQQEHILKTQFDDSLQEKERAFKNLDQRARNDRQEALKDRTEKLSQKHGLEMRSVSDDRDRRLAEAQRNLIETKSALTNQMKDKERIHDLEMGRTKNNFENVYTEQQREFNTLLSSRDAILQSEKSKMGERYGEALKAKLEELDKAYEYLRDSSIERVDREVRAANNEKKRIESDRIVDMITNKRIRNLEKDHIIGQYEDRIKGMEYERSHMRDEINKMADQRIDNTLRKTDSLIQEANRDNRTKQSLSNEKHREDRANLQVEHSREVNRLNTRTEDRVQKIMKATNEAQNDQLKMHSENVDKLKTNYSENLARQREAQMESLKDTYLRMDKRLKETEDKYERKIDQIVENYEGKIKQLEDSYDKEFKNQETHFSSRMGQRDKEYKKEIESADIKNDLKLQKQEELHEKEIERLERRHQEQMASLANKLNYYRKQS